MLACPGWYLDVLDCVCGIVCVFIENSYTKYKYNFCRRRGYCSAFHPSVSLLDCQRRIRTFDVFSSDSVASCALFSVKAGVLFVVFLLDRGIGGCKHI